MLYKAILSTLHGYALDSIDNVVVNKVTMVTVSVKQYRIPIIKYYGRETVLFFIIGIPIKVRQHLYIKTIT